MPEHAGGLGFVPYGAAIPQIIEGTAPGANTNFSLSLDSRWVWRFKSVKFTLTTDANAANRIVSFDYADGNGSVFLKNGAGVLVTASTTGLVFQGKAHQGVSDFTSSGSDLTAIYFPIESVYLVGSQQVQINVVNKQAGDTLTAIRLYAEQYLNRPPEVP